MSYIRVNKLKIYYFDNKLVGSPLIFIHGWLGSSLEWIYQYNYFNSKNHVVLIDLPGFGKSDKPKIDYTIDFYVKQIVEFLNLHGYNDVILVGHSLGGMIAQNIAIQNPSLVKKLILISTTAEISQSKRNNFELLLIRVIFKLWYRKFLKNIIKRILSINKETRELSKLYNNALKIPKSVVLNSFKNMTSKFKLNKEISNIYQPTIILHGNEDKIISSSMANNLGDSIPNSDVIAIKDSSHRVMIEKHLEVNKIIENFIKS
ncbi:MAG: alpha/beta fold hydrolase [Promethearchaeota archaeon]|jgi:pimeloyl-ACP methyl ester carboxylesterase